MNSVRLSPPSRLCSASGMLLLLLGLAGPARAQFSYYTYNGEAIIDGYTGPGGAVVIPNRLGGKPVAEIGDDAFKYCNTLTGVTIPASVTRIGNDAFSSCGQLTAVVIPGSVKKIGNNAFNGCHNLQSVAIGRGLIELGLSVFSGCTKLETITVSADNPAFSSAGGVLFNKRKTKLLFCSALKSGAYAIPATVSRIERGAFGNCTRLTEIQIPAALVHMEPGTFANCPALRAFTVAAGNAAFRSVNGVVFNRSRTRLFQCPGGLTGTYAVPAGVRDIGDEAFAWCLSLTGVTIPAGTTNIGVRAFWYCPRLTRLVFPNSVVAVGDTAFWECTRLTEVVFGNRLTRLGSSAFWGCTALRKVCFKGNAPAIDEWADVFQNARRAVVYRLPWTSGWRTTFSGRPTRAWDVYEPDNSMAAARRIGRGQTQTRCIAPAGNEDWAKFTVGSAGARNLRLETAGPAGDTQLWLYRANRTLLAYNNDGGTGAFSKIARPGLPPGTYYVRIREFGNNNPIRKYQLSVSWSTP